MAKAEETTETTNVTPAGPVQRPLWRHPLVLVGAVLVLAVLAAGAVMHHERAVQRWAMNDFDRPGAMSTFRGKPRLMGGKLTQSNELRLQGVVTKVDGDTVTVAGGGKTNTVKTSSGTQYSGGSSVAVNDSVIVSGTLNGGTFEADSILVNP